MVFIIILGEKRLWSDVETRMKLVASLTVNREIRITGRRKTRCSTVLYRVRVIRLAWPEVRTGAWTSIENPHWRGHSFVPCRTKTVPRNLRNGTTQLEAIQSNLWRFYSILEWKESFTFPLWSRTFVETNSFSSELCSCQERMEHRLDSGCDEKVTTPKKASAVRLVEEKGLR